MHRFAWLVAAVLTLAWPMTIGRANDGVALQFRGAVKQGELALSLAEIEALPRHRFRTATPWHDGAPEFEGVLMRDLLTAVEAKGQKIRVVALNRYATDIPTSDFSEFDAILAFKRDGAYMPVRDKGPFFIVYPYDANPALKSDKYYIRSAWQVASITVE